MSQRNIFVDGEWGLRQVDDYGILSSFDCGDEDLNEYFREDAILHKQELITQTYCFFHETDNGAWPLALMDLCNDAVKLKDLDDDIDISRKKRYPFLPAVKITRFGVIKELQGDNLGSHALNLIKKFFLTNNRTGCRFITVDAYNRPAVLSFYLKNGFIPFNDKDKDRHTRALFFDLKRFSG